MLTANSLSAPQKARPLVISNVGYTDQEVPIGGQNNIAVSLVRQDNSINEVVVTAVGIKRSEKALGYAVSKVNPDNLIQKSEPDLLKSMQGQRLQALTYVRHKALPALPRESSCVVIHLSLVITNL
jgi:hypothetical protein